MLVIPGHTKLLEDKKERRALKSRVGQQLLDSHSHAEKPDMADILYFVPQNLSHVNVRLDLEEKQLLAEICYFPLSASSNFYLFVISTCRTCCVCQC